MSYRRIGNSILYEENQKRLGAIEWINQRNTMIITHTVVSPRMRGQGIARKLLEEAVLVAEAENLSIKPLCTYAAKYLDQIPGAKERHVSS